MPSLSSASRWATPGPVRVVEWNVAHLRTLWRPMLLNSFLQPLLYLLGLGVGVGTLVNRNVGPADSLGGLDYARFVAPGLLSTTAMAIAFFEGAWPVLGGFTWERHYLAMAATPLRPRDLTLGHLLWVAVRLLAATTAVTVAISLFPSARSAALVPGIAFATWSGLAFGMAMLAFASFMEWDLAFPAVQRFVVIPLFLFGGAFFPVSQLPGWLQAVIQVSPLWHGTELCRDLVADRFDWTTALWQLAYLTAWIVAGLVVATRQFTRRLGR